MKKIAVLTYNVPHQKTFDILMNLYVKGYRDIEVYSTPMGYKKKFKPLLEHRPSLRYDLSPIELCRILGFKYNPNIDEIFNLPENTIFLIAGSNILEKNLTDKYKVVNSHPGIIPLVRGLDAFKWALYEGLPIGVTVHLVTGQVDSGPIILQRTISIDKFETFHSLALKLYDLEVHSLIDSIKILDTHLINEFTKVDDSNSLPRKRMPKIIEQDLINRFVCILGHSDAK